MATRSAGYDIVAVSTGQRLSHRTRQAALDNWRTRWHGQPVQIWRRYADGSDVLVAEGTWHQP